MLLDNLKKDKYSKISIAFSILCLIVIIKINHDIASRYLSSDGKTKALFGITEILCFYYQYYFVILSLTAFVFAIFGSKRKENRLINQIAYLLGLFSMIIIFLRIWRIMI